MLKSVLKWETWDHPLVMAFLMTLAVIPMIVAIYYVGDRVGLPLPALGQPTNA
jgi:hypothetical protein